MENKILRLGDISKVRDHFQLFSVVGHLPICGYLQRYWQHHAGYRQKALACKSRFVRVSYLNDMPGYLQGELISCVVSVFQLSTMQVLLTEKYGRDVTR